MNFISFLTDEAHPWGTPDDQLLVAPLAALGFDAQFVNWETGNFGDTAHFVRSTWNYHRDPQSFLWQMATIPRLHNQVETLVWNSDKRYLAELAGRGIPTIPTQFGAGADLPGILARCGWPAVVVKPAISAGGDRTLRIRNEGESESALERLGCDPSTFMVQPYLDRVTTDGEVSVLLAGGEITHAVVKRPAAGNFLIHEEHGGKSEACTISPELARLSLAAVACAPAPPAYARADWLFGPEGPLLVELELIEPALYLRYDANAAERFARVFASLAGRV